MAAEGRRTPDDLTETAAPPAAAADPKRPRRPGDRIPAAQRLREEPFSYDFFQAVRLLQLLRPDAPEVGRAGPVEAEPVRFRAMASTSFPPSMIADLQAPPDRPDAPPTMTVSFLGLIGPKGVLPQHYTELIMRQEFSKDRDKGALRAWFDLFNHRLTGLFYRAWEKYRFIVGYERAHRPSSRPKEPDTFTTALLSLVGLGTRGLADRLRSSSPADPVDQSRIDDLSLLHFAGLFSHRPRNAAGLASILQEYFAQPADVRQFQGQWLELEPGSQSRLGEAADSRNALGWNVVAGSRVWEIRSKVRIVLGPLSYGDFKAFLPNPSHPGSFFALAHLVRFYLGPDLDFDVQLLLKGEQVPLCQLGANDDEGAILGWNSWICTAPLDFDAPDAIFEGIEVYPPQTT
jgi:type VI secretion system protein ImpH